MCGGSYTLNFKYAMEGPDCTLVVNILFGADNIVQLYSPTGGEWRSVSRSAGNPPVLDRRVRFSAFDSGSGSALCRVRIDEVAFVRS